MKSVYVLPTIFSVLFIIIGAKLLSDGTYLKGGGFAAVGGVMAILLIWKSRLFRRK